LGAISVRTIIRGLSDVVCDWAVKKLKHINANSKEKVLLRIAAKICMMKSDALRLI
jgi:hypothetical protein